MKARALIVLMAGCWEPRVLPPRPIEVVGPPELVDVSSEYVEIRLAVSPDGTVRLWGSTDRPGGPGGWDIWMSRRMPDMSWSAPAPVPFDSAANDFDPAFSPDGRFVYFFSNRPGGAGGDDIYRVPVKGVEFGEVEHLGPEINTPGDEWAPSPSADGLLFASNKPGHKHDLYFAPATGNGFRPAHPLGGDINAEATDEFDATHVPGGAIVFARSTDVEHDPISLYIAYPTANGYDAGTRLPLSVNVDGGYTLGPSIDLRDPTHLYFSSHRPEASAGKLDIYLVRLR